MGNREMGKEFGYAREVISTHYIHGISWEPCCMLLLEWVLLSSCTCKIENGLEKECSRRIGTLMLTYSPSSVRKSNPRSS